MINFDYHKKHKPRGKRAKEYIKLNEISDKHLIGEQAFKGIINSILIVKYGASMLQANC